MNSSEAVKTVFSYIKDEPAVLATGFISRFGQAARNRSENFYMIGSMGMVSSIALGIAINRPGKKIVALDGDGAVLMNLGTLANIGALKPDNLIHIVIDNSCYESTGGQASEAKRVRLDKIAKSAGYRYAKLVRTKFGLEFQLKKLFSRKGPAFLLIKTSPETAPPPIRIQETPDEIAKNFARCLR